MRVIHSARSKPLPDDVGELKAIIAELTESIIARDSKIAVLEHNVALLTKWAFAQKSERRPKNPEVDPASLQGLLLFPEILEAAERVADRTGACGDVEIAPPAPEAGDETDQQKAKKRKKGRRRSFPANLPVVRTTFELPASERACSCCGESMPAIGEDISKELERVEFTIVHEIVRTKYACRDCKASVKTAPGPDRVIDRGLLGVGFLAHMITERFSNHMPYNRLEAKYRSEGLDLSRSVLCTSAGRAAEILRAIKVQLVKEILASGYVQTDDTGVLKLDPGKKKSARCEMWTYRSPGVGVFYDFADPDARDGPLEVLADYRGFLQADAHRCYEPLYRSGHIVEVACFAHARRRFVDAEATEPDLAKQAVDLIGALYGIERDAKAKGLTFEQRRDLRQRLSRPILKQLEDWLTATKPKVLARGPLGMAISYADKNWAALCRYTEDGRLEIDNNGAERALRCVAVGRKNWTFLGSETGGETAATLLTLVMSAKEAGVDPRMYLRDVLLRIAHCSDVTTLTPRGWKERWLPEVHAHHQSIVERMLERKAEGTTSTASL